MHSPIISLLIRTCNKAANKISRDFLELEKLQVSRKSLGDFVTNADLKSEKIIIRELSKARPEFPILSEESGEIEAKVDFNQGDIRYKWIIDPIDGTSNFMHGNPNFCISVGLEATKGDISEVTAGVIYCPFLNETYWAEKGKGAYVIGENCSDTKIRISGRRNISETLCATKSKSILYSKSHTIDVLKREKAKFRISGSIALDCAYVASGKVDMVMHDDFKPWDIAAGSILIKEAGGKFVTLRDDDSNSDIVIAANPHLYNKIVLNKRSSLGAISKE